jgi:hypothetical protein
MVVASSNNKAVENVSAELPGLDAVASDATELRYFKTLSDALHQSETWGATAAVLGNARNRSRFKRAFWWDDDNGLSNYLWAAAGSVREAELRRTEDELRRALLGQQNSETTWQTACVQHQQAKQRLAEAQQKYGVVLADAAFFALEHGRRHQMTPWFPRARSCELAAPSLLATPYRLRTYRKAWPCFRGKDVTFARPAVQPAR